uniref:ANTAR domain-containing protein n=1 Tax=uncultured Nocardioidaceae bacterium TaxID=253824 RepID=A0A6J4LYQ4_9ACTN|nr:MAG: hypothetical protein AVDCRST_MAG46-2191 [uncultured Nocardioidaceae bacterium]
MNEATENFQGQLEAAMVTRPLIEQGKGVLIGTRCETPDQAFAELQHVSQNHNVKLNLLAGALVDLACGRDVDDPVRGGVGAADLPVLTPGLLVLEVSAAAAPLH